MARIVIKAVPTWDLWINRSNVISYDVSQKLMITNMERHSVKDIIIHQRTTASKDHWLQQNQSLPNSARPQILLSSLLLSRTEKKHNLVAEWAMRANKHQLDSCARVFFSIYVREGNSGRLGFWRYFIFRKLRKCTSKSNYKSICLEIFLALCIEKKILWNRK